MRKIIYISFICSIFWLCLSGFYEKQPQTSESNVKAVFIFNFTKYLEWTNNTKSKTFDIVIFGKSDITAPLREIAGLKKAGEKKIRIIEIDNIDEIPPCNIMYVDPSQEKYLSNLLQTAKEKEILIISNKKGYGVLGVPINFVTIDGKVKFEININSIEEIGIKPSSQLLKLAILIKNGKYIDGKN
ncbi:MAG: hypothetical protein A2W98_14455 [Bacteroidetes bacterium GWF2_33_38]|nr:MAG: hypothetical protein A2W98_14455 [Bacteroidetes bacterium GWF2_33_38]OFY76098.1 MAG: hypothetical protein A2265_06845 [Bacteroidetes bacterium RIFOXYA12_FULL_33_9]OFY90166.1 MAG: hypothetical protein A2236_12620 [Bacteroidetes bacterium RIFOXYA2_FULL_33_7]